MGRGKGISKREKIPIRKKTRSQEEYRRRKNFLLSSFCSLFFLVFNNQEKIQNFFFKTKRKIDVVPEAWHFVAEAWHLATIALKKHAALT
jgi:hypothetical protein